MTKPSLILIGAGGHAHSCIDVIEEQVTAMLDTLKEVEGADQDCMLNARTHFRKGFNLTKDAMLRGDGR
jgi:hypothetical protein